VEETENVMKKAYYACYYGMEILSQEEESLKENRKNYSPTSFFASVGRVPSNRQPSICRCKVQQQS